MFLWNLRSLLIGHPYVVFMAVTPDASPCVARGPRFRQALDHGHFYVYANKIGTVRVATSGYVPWVDYPVKGWWLDNLWTEHKLAHDVYLEYACLECSRQSCAPGSPFTVWAQTLTTTLLLSMCL